MRRRLAYGVMVLVLVAGTAVVVLLSRSHAQTYDGKRVLVEWTDVERHIAFHVTEAPGAIVKQNSRLHVTRDGRDDVVMIDDDAIFSAISLVRYEHWLLVVCRGPDEVWAGYDYESGRLYGEYQWAALPFTRWSGQGSVVAERSIRDTACSPTNFPRPQ